MLEFIAPGFLYSVAKDGVGLLARLFRRKGPRLSPTETIAKRQQWKVEVDEKLWERRRKKLGMDIIVRDVQRINEYPDAKDRKGHFALVQMRPDGNLPPRSFAWVKLGDAHRGGREQMEIHEPRGR